MLRANPLVRVGSLAVAAAANRIFLPHTIKYAELPGLHTHKLGMKGDDVIMICNL
jgi:hypothetical protein